MSAPLALLPTCTLFVDGVRFADGSTVGEVDTDPVALTDLSVVWGRDNTLDQPEPGTCRFRVLDIGGGRKFTDALRMGSRIQVRADAMIFPDPTVPIFTWDAGFEGMAVGAVPPSSVTGGQLTVSSGGPPHSGARSALIQSSDDAVTVLLPPAPFSADTNAWAAVPRTLAGQTWQWGLSVLMANLLAANQTVRVMPVAFTSPSASSAVPALDAALTVPVGAVGWQTLLADFVPPADVWLGLRVDVRPGGGPTWDEAPADGLQVLQRTNSALAPGGNNLNHYGTNTAGTLTVVAGWGQWASAVRHTRATAATATRLTARYSTTVPVSTQVTVKVRVRASVQTTGMAFYLRPDVGNSTGQVTLATNQTVPAGTSEWTWTANSPAAASSGLGCGLALVWTPGNVGDTVDITGIQVEIGATVGPYFDGDTPDTATDIYAWTGTPQSSPSTWAIVTGLRWDDVPNTVRWDDVGGVYLDDLKLLAPASGALRAATVFVGRITDMTARYDMSAGGVVVDVIAQTHLAEMDNRYVGDVPWLAEPLSTRMARIVAASGQTITYQVDSSVAAKQVSWRDVDSRPSGDLMHQLAQSVGGALWSAATATGDAYVWLEDINNRPAMHVLVRDPDGTVRIHPGTIPAADAITLDACDVLLEPVEWVQTTEDDATRVVIAWKDQTLNTEGNPAPTVRDYVVTNTEAEAATGRRRVQISTELATQTDAALVADAVLARLTTPGWRVRGLTWDMTAVDRVDADTLDRVLTVLDGVARLGLAVRLVNVPAWFSPASGADVSLFLEGGTFRNSDGAWTLDLITSSAISQGAGTVRWDDVPSGWRWDDFDPAITWNDLHGVGI